MKYSTFKILLSLALALAPALPGICRCTELSVNHDCCGADEEPRDQKPHSADCQPCFISRFDFDLRLFQAQDVSKQLELSSLPDAGILSKPHILQLQPGTQLAHFSRRKSYTPAGFTRHAVIPRAPPETLS